MDDTKVHSQQGNVAYTIELMHFDCVHFQENVNDIICMFSIMYAWAKVWA